MFGVRPLLFGMLLGGGAMGFAHRYHVVYTAEGLIVVPRTQRVELLSSYADTRGWNATRWSEAPELAQAMLNDGRGDLMLQSAAKELVNDAKDSLGLSQPQSDWTPSDDAASRTQTMPEIVFRKPEPVSTQTTTTTSSTPSKEGSLLNRLSRQFGGTSAGPTQTTGDEVKERPLSRERQRPEYRALTPVRPANVPPSANLDDRAAAPAPMHTTARDRVATELGALGEIPNRYREVAKVAKVAAPPAVAPGPPVVAPEPPIVVFAAMPPEAQHAQPAARQAAPLPPRQPGSDAYFGRPLTGVTPHLRERLPPSVSTPLRALSSPGMPLEGELRSY